MLIRRFPVAVTAVLIGIATVALTVVRVEVVDDRWASSLRFESILFGCVMTLALVATDRVRSVAGSPPVFAAALIL